MPLHGQIIDEVFGKNRVQYHDNFSNWFHYESENFHTYWYGMSRNVAESAVQLAELDFKEIHSVLEHRLNDRIELIVYTDLTDLKQSNIGLGDYFMPEEVSFRVFENKIFLCFKGDHNDLRRQVREGIAEVYLNSMLFGSNLQEIVQNAVQLNLPEWYKAGIISYVASDWNPEFERQFREQFLHPKGRYREFEKLAKKYPELAGHSLWYYIAEVYGKPAVSNLLYITRINRSLDNSFFYVLGTSYTQIIRDWKYYFEKKYVDESNVEVRPDWTEIRLKRRGKIPVQNVTLSPDGSQLAFIQNDHGRSFVYLIPERGERRKLLFKTGMRNYIQENDTNYPIIAFSPDGQRLSVIYERRDVIYLREYDLATMDYQQQSIAPQLERVYDMDYYNADQLVLSATNNGFSNLFLYFPKTRQFNNLTNDFYNDLDVETGEYQGQKGVYFSSNRPKPQTYDRLLDSVLPLQAFNIYFLQWEGGENKLHQITKTTDRDERDVIYDVDHLYFIQSGREESVRTRMSLIDGDRGYYWRDANYLMDYSKRNGYVAKALTLRDRSYLVWKPDETPEGSKVVMIAPKDGEVPVLQEKPVRLQPSERVKFQAPFGDYKRDVEEEPAADTITKEIEQIVEAEPVSIPVVHEFNPVRAIPYRLSFRVDDLSTTMDNQPLFQGLTLFQNDQSFNSGQGSVPGFQQGITPPPLGILFKGTIKDLFEDYVIEGGARYPTNFNGSEYFMIFENRKNRIDKRFTAYRRVIRDAEEAGFFSTIRKKYVTLLGRAEVIYPFDVYTSIRGTASIRNDRFSYSITDQNTLMIPDVNEQRLGLRVEYVFDNTVDMGINMLQGTRYKAFSEFVKRFGLRFKEPASFNFRKGWLTIIGLDFRHYERILDRSIIATRVAGATSLGPEKILYQMGGINNWLFPNFSGQIPFPESDNFAYQQLAQQMRGFNLNIRNGSSFVVWNTELRIPIFQYLSRGKIRMSFLRNFQVTGFADVGTAWLGVSPFDRQNPLNTLRLSNPAVEIEVNYYRDPIVFGYGIGARSTLFGYLVRVDYGWGVDTKVVGDPILYISIGTDF